MSRPASLSSNLVSDMVIDDSGSKEAKKLQVRKGALIECLFRTDSDRIFIFLKAARPSFLRQHQARRRAAIDMSGIVKRLSSLFRLGNARYLAGTDLSQNKYYEYPSIDGDPDPRRSRRLVRYREHKELGEFDQSTLPTQWLMWLRHTRRSAPTIEVRLILRAAPKESSSC